MKIIDRNHGAETSPSHKKLIDIRKIIGEGYDDFWNFKGRYRLVKGGRGSKKSTTASLWYVYNMMLYWYKYHIRVETLCLRAYFVNHFDSTYSQLKWAIKTLGVEHLWHCYRNPLYIRFIPSGGRILFKGLDSPDKITSIKSPDGYFAWVWVEEAYEIKSAQAFEKVNLSIRGKLPPPLYYQMTFTFNPYSEKHWLKHRYFDKVSPDTCISEDGEIYAITRNYDCNEFLDAAFLKEMDRLRMEHPNEYAVVGLGNWGIQKGIIYSGCYEVKEVMSGFVLADKIRSLSEEGYELRCGLDFGFTNDLTAFIVIMTNIRERKIYILDEFVGREMTPNAISSAIKAKGAIFVSCPIIADSANPMAIDLIRRDGIYGIKRSVKGAGSILAGIENIKSYRMIISPRCVNARIELENYKWKVNKNDENEFLNEPSDEFNHSMDALRYAMEGVTPSFFGGIRLSSNIRR